MNAYLYVLADHFFRLRDAMPLRVPLAPEVRLFAFHGSYRLRREEEEAEEEEARGSTWGLCVQCYASRSSKQPQPLLDASDR